MKSCNAVDVAVQGTQHLGLHLLGLAVLLVLLLLSPAVVP